MGKAPSDARLQRRGVVGGQQCRERAGIGRHRRTVHTPARTGKRLEKNLASARAVRENRGIHASKEAAEVIEPGDGKIAHIGPAVTQSVVHSAFDGIEPAFGRVSERRFALFAETDVLLLEQLFESREHERQRQLVGMLISFVLLGRTGAKEYDLDVLPVRFLETAGVSADRRRQRGDVRRVVRQILADHVDRSRARARNEERRVRLLQDPGHVGADGLRTVRGFAGGVETGPDERVREPGHAYARKIAGEAGRYRGDHFRPRRKHFLETCVIAAYLLGVRRAHLDAFTAGHAGLGNHARLAADDPYRLDRAVADAFVAVLAAVFYRIYGGGLLHANSFRFYFLGNRFSSRSDITPSSTLVCALPSITTTGPSEQRPLQRHAPRTRSTSS